MYRSKNYKVLVCHFPLLTGAKELVNKKLIKITAFCTQKITPFNG